MNSQALKNNSVKSPWTTELITGDMPLPIAEDKVAAKISLQKSTVYLYGVMAFLFQKSIRYENHRWSTHLRLAHVYRKLNKDPKVRLLYNIDYYRFAHSFSQ
jgi:hypothetical protein